MHTHTAGQSFVLTIQLFCPAVTSAVTLCHLNTHVVYIFDCIWKVFVTLQEKLIARRSYALNMKCLNPDVDATRLIKKMGFLNNR